MLSLQHLLYNVPKCSIQTQLCCLAEHHEEKEMAQQIVGVQQIEDMYDSLYLEYPIGLSMISGARYHLVVTYSVRQPVWSCSGSASVD